MTTKQEEKKKTTAAAPGGGAGGSVATPPAPTVPKAGELEPARPVSAKEALSAKVDDGWRQFWGGQVFPTEDELARMMKLCAFLIKSQLVPTGLDTVDKLMVVLMNAREMGIPPMTAVKGMYPVKGKVAFEGWLALAVIKMRVPTVKIDFTTVSKKESTITAWRPGMDEGTWREFTYTWDMAETAGLTRKMKDKFENGKKTGEYNSSLYQYHPETMLCWRAVGLMVKFMFTDVLNGGWLREEMQEVIDEEQARLALASTTGAPMIPEVTSLQEQLKAPTPPAPPVPAVPAAAAPAPPPPPAEEAPWGELTGEEECTCWHESKGHLGKVGKCQAPKCTCEAFQFQEAETPPAPAAPLTPDEEAAKLLEDLKAIQGGDRPDQAVDSMGRLMLDAQVPVRKRPEIVACFESRIKLFVDAAKTTQEMSNLVQAVPEILRSDELIAYYGVAFRHLQKGNNAKPAGKS